MDGRTVSQVERAAGAPGRVHSPGLGSDGAGSMDGQLFAPGSGSGIAVRLGLTPDGAGLEATGETVSRTLPLAACRFEVGGYQDSMLIVTHEEAPGAAWSVYAPRDGARKLLAGCGLASVQEALRGAHGALAERKARGLAIGLVVLALLGASVWVANKAVDAVLWYGVGWIPPSWEITLGTQVVDSMYPEAECVKDPEVVEPVRQIVDRLLASTDRGGYEFHVRIGKEDQVNAFAVPGGQMVVLTGLLAKAESPEEVAGVLAHEIHHVLRRHSLRKMMAYVKWQIGLALLLGDLQTVAELLLAHASKLAVLAYDRDMEREADYDGLELLQRAGIDPKGMIQFFARLAREEGILAGSLTLISTHPGSAERAAELERWAALAKGLPLRPFDIDWKRVQLRLKEAHP